MASQESTQKDLSLKGTEGSDPGDIHCSEHSIFNEHPDHTRHSHPVIERRGEQGLNKLSQVLEVGEGRGYFITVSPFRVSLGKADN